MYNTVQYYSILCACTYTVQFLELERKKQEEEARRNYAALLNTDAVPVVLNEEEFDCPVCYTPIDPGDGIRLRGCLHMVCK